MLTSNKFRHIEGNLIKLVVALLNNENIKKYIYYLDDNPLKHPNVSDSLIETGHVVLTPFHVNTLQKDKVMMFISPYEANLKGATLSKLCYLIDVVIPNNKWLLHNNGQLRAFRLADEIAQEIDGRDNIGIGETTITQFKVYTLSNGYSGMSLWVNVNTSTQKGVR